MHHKAFNSRDKKDLLLKIANQFLQIVDSSIDKDISDFQLAFAVINNNQLHLPKDNCSLFEIQRCKKMFVIGQAILLLMQYKNNRTTQIVELEKSLIRYISLPSVNLKMAYGGYSFFNLILRTGSINLIKASTPKSLKNFDYSQEFPSPDRMCNRSIILLSNNIEIIQFFIEVCEAEKIDFLPKEFFEKIISSINFPELFLIIKKHLLVSDDHFIQLEYDYKIRSYKEIILNSKAEELRPYLQVINHNESNYKEILFKLLDVAIGANAHPSTFMILIKLRELSIISETTFFNRCIQHIYFALDSDKYAASLSNFFSMLKSDVQYPYSNLQINELSVDSIKFIIKYFAVEQQKLIYQFYDRPIKRLLADNLLFDLLRHSAQNNFALNESLKKLKSDEIEALINTDNMTAFLSWCLASGIDPATILDVATKKNACVLTILLYATTHPNSKFTNQDALLIFQNFPCLPINKTHILLAKKLNNPILYNEIIKRSTNQTIIDNKKIDNISYIQGAIRLINRSNNLYPRLFNKHENYSFWLERKANNRYQTLLRENKDLAYFAIKFLEIHLVPNYPSRAPLFLPFTHTFHYVKSSSSFHSIMRSGSLLSAKARHHLQMNFFDTRLTKDDIKINDDELVCTTSFPYWNDFTLAFNLEKIPLHYLQHVIIKLGDYACRKKSIPINITPDISMRCHFKDINNSNYIFYNKKEPDHEITINLTGMDEIYHGINGFKDALCHLFYIIHAIPDEGKNIKKSIIDYFYVLEKDGKFLSHMQSIFEEIFRYIEIDFQYELPLSFQYIKSISTSNGLYISMKSLQQLLETGDRQHFIAFFQKNQVFNLLAKPFVLSEMLKMTSAARFCEVAEILTFLSPSAYLALQEPLCELPCFINEKEEREPQYKAY